MCDRPIIYGPSAAIHYTCSCSCGLRDRGAILSAIGLYQPLVNLAGAGATIPLSGFGHNLAQGAIRAVESKGLLGAFAGGIEATAVGIVAAVVFGYTFAVLFNPRN